MRTGGRSSRARRQSTGAGADLRQQSVRDDLEHRAHRGDIELGLVVEPAVTEPEPRVVAEAARPAPTGQFRSASSSARSARSALDRLLPGGVVRDGDRGRARDRCVDGVPVRLPVGVAIGVGPLRLDGLVGRRASFFSSFFSSLPFSRSALRAARSARFSASAACLASFSACFAACLSRAMRAASSSEEPVSLGVARRVGPERPLAMPRDIVPARAPIAPAPMPPIGAPAPFVVRRAPLRPARPAAAVAAKGAAPPPTGRSPAASTPRSPPRVATRTPRRPTAPSRAPRWRRRDRADARLLAARAEAGHETRPMPRRRCRRSTWSAGADHHELGPGGAEAGALLVERQGQPAPISSVSC